MTLSRSLRPALVCLVVLGGGLMTASCGMVDGDARRFEGLAQHVADIRLDSPRADPQGLRPAMPSGRDNRLKVEVMDPHDLWDARDGDLRAAIAQVGSRTAEVAAPVVAEAVVQRVSERIAEAAPMRTAIARPAEDIPATPVSPRTAIQLGAYSSPQAARAAWASLSSGAARSALKGLSPVYEAVEVKGRPLTRLKVAAPAESAVAICRAAAVSDPWCARRV